MPFSLPRTAKPYMIDQANDAIPSALRTPEAEAEGVTALIAALTSDLGGAFLAAVELIANSKGRLIVTGLGKSGHIGRKVAATFASTGTPAFFVHAAEASHGDLGMGCPACTNNHGIQFLLNELPVVKKALGTTAALCHFLYRSLHPVFIQIADSRYLNIFLPEKKPQVAHSPATAAY